MLKEQRGQWKGESWLARELTGLSSWARSVPGGLDMGNLVDCLGCGLRVGRVVKVRKSSITPSLCPDPEPVSTSTQLHDFPWIHEKEQPLD